MFYHPANADLTNYGAGLRMWLLALCGKLLGIQFHVEGLPFGARFRFSHLNESGVSGATASDTFTGAPAVYGGLSFGHGGGSES